MQLLITRKGVVEVIVAPDPVPQDHELLIRVTHSTISAGTETQAIQSHALTPTQIFKRGFNALEKIQRTLRQKGLKSTIQKVGEKMGEAVPLGYSLSGEVLKVGCTVKDFRPGDLVVAIGPGAYHGTLACVPRLFAAHLPTPSLASNASCAALACVGLHAFHRAEIQPGEQVAVFGLGIIGLLATQILRSQGNPVIAFDPLAERRALVESSGVQTWDPNAFDWEKQHSTRRIPPCRAVFLCAKTSSPSLIRQAIQISAHRGRIMVVGEFPMHIPRDLAYEKEVEIRLSAAYGEGRYDPDYLHHDRDYPENPPRWSVRKNLDQFIKMLGTHQIRPEKLAPSYHDFTTVATSYPQQSGAPLGIIRYPTQIIPQPSKGAWLPPPPDTSIIRIGILGSGSFATGTHIPLIRRQPGLFRLEAICGRRPHQVQSVATQLQIPFATCEESLLTQSKHLDTILIVTPHRWHAQQTLSSLQNGKHVFVEKPLCINMDELNQIESLMGTESQRRRILWVGYNRRFAPLNVQLKSWFQRRQSPLQIQYRFLALPIPDNPWIENTLHGGRFLGEGCHAVDWILQMVDQPIRHHSAKRSDDGSIFCEFTFEDQSTAKLEFSRKGSPNDPKEFITIEHDDYKHQLTDHKSLETKRGSKPTKIQTSPSKGYMEMLEGFAEAVRHPPQETDPWKFIFSTRILLSLNAMVHSE